MSKAHIEKYAKQEAILREKEILLRLKHHPGIITLEQTFQVANDSYFNQML